MTEEEIQQCLKAVEYVLRTEPCTVSVRRGMRHAAPVNETVVFEPTNEMTIRIDANGGVKEDTDGRS